MTNELVRERLKGMQAQLMALHESSSTGSTSSKGADRERFLNLFLREVLPPTVRLGSGEVADSTGGVTGQLDIVVEYPFAPSLPVISGGSRMYFAESVAAAIEVKSDVEAQWGEVERTAKRVRSMTLEYSGMSCVSGIDASRIPFFVVGYRGWRQASTLAKKIDEGVVDGILVLDGGAYSCNLDWNPGVELEGPGALLGFLTSLHWAVQRISWAGVKYNEYVDPGQEGGSAG